MKISLCIICKDEEKKIARCINSIKSVVDEIIVVDTGSTDGTIQIAERLGAKIFKVLWEDDFSKPRNYALDRSSGDWIIFLDADEYLMESSLGKIKMVIAEAERMKKDFVLCELLNEGEGRIYNTFKTIRIFKNSPDIRYEGRIHEKIYKKDEELQGIEFIDEIKVLHDGYAPSVMLEKNKAERDLRLLLEESKKNPNSSDLCYYLMKTYNEKNDVDKAWEYACKTLEYNNGQLKGIKQGAYERLLDISRAIKKEKKVVDRLYQEAIKVDAYYPDFDFRYGLYCYEMNDYSNGIKYLCNCIYKVEQYKGTESSIVMGDITKVLKVLAECYLKEQEIEKAISILVKILRVNPYEFKALYDLINILGNVESGESIGNFLGNFYDYTNIKDQMLLIKMSQKTQNEGLFNYVMSYVNEDVRNTLIKAKEI